MDERSNLSDLARKHCPRCAYANRITAKVCSQCGYAFPKIELAGMIPRKRCPVCDHDNRLRAKVCTQCGHHFRGEPLRADQPQKNLTDKSQPQNQAKWCPRCGKVCRLQAKVCSQCGHRFRTNFNADSIEETPIIPTADEPIVLPLDFDQSVAPPEVAITAPQNLEGEPAPDISDQQLDAMRYTSPANTDPYGRLILSLKKGRP